MGGGMERDKVRGGAEGQSAVVLLKHNQALGVCSALD